MTAYSLGPCTIDAASREVRFGAAAQPVPPQVFDVLLYLVEHRERVVPKDELLEAVWGKVVVSESVVARAVMKARRAIQDSADEPRFIKTVQRVGYRFVAPEAFAVVAVPAEEAATAGRSVHRVALMPIDNRTGDEQLDWVSLGLLSLVNHALANDRRLSVMPVANVVSALGATATEDMTSDRRALALNRVLGTDWAVTAAITRQDDMLSLDFRLFGANGVTQSGFVRCAEPTELGAGFARAVEARLFPDGQPRIISLEFDDPLANQAFARAIQMMEQGKADAARQLLDVVLAIEPHSLAVRTEYVVVLTQLRDRRCLALGEQLLDEARAAGDVRRIADVHAALLRACHAFEGYGERARQHADEALRLVDDSGDDWAIRVRESVAIYAGKTGNFALAMTLLRRTVDDTERAGNRMRWCTAMANLGAVEGQLGQHRASLLLYEQAAAGFEALNHRRAAFFCLGSVATIEANLGRYATSLKHADALLGVRPDPAWHDVLSPLLRVCSIYDENGDVVKIDEALKLGAESMRNGLLRTTLQWQAMNAHRCSCVGDLAAAGDHFDGALEKALAANDAGYGTAAAALVLHTLLRRGLYAEAHERAARLLDLPLLSARAELTILRAGASALDSHRRGDRDAARVALASALGAPSDDRWAVYLRLDAAWLALESHEPTHARELLAEAHAWPDEHPRGMAVKARLLFEERRFDEARSLLKCAMALRPRCAEDASAHLDIYRRAAAGEAIAIPPVRRLPSVW